MLSSSIDLIRSETIIRRRTWLLVNNYILSRTLQLLLKSRQSMLIFITYVLNPFIVIGRVINKFVSHTCVIRKMELLFLLFYRNTSDFFFYILNE